MTKCESIKFRGPFFVFRCLVISIVGYAIFPLSRCRIVAYFSKCDMPNSKSMLCPIQCNTYILHYFPQAFTSPHLTLCYVILHRGECSFLVLLMMDMTWFGQLDNYRHDIQACTFAFRDMTFRLVCLPLEETHE